MSDDINKIELRSEEVQEILGHIPSIIIRYGITVVFLVIALIIAGCFFFTYPDIVTAPIEVTTQNPPAMLVARASGALDQILVVDSQRVVQGQLLAIIQNPANYRHVIALQTFLDSLDESRLYNSSGLNRVKCQDDWQLGGVQDFYSSFIKAYSQYQLFLEMDYNHQKISALMRKESELLKYSQILEKQSELKKQEHQLNKTQFQRDSLLFQRAVIAKSDFENARKTLLQSEMDYESSRSSVVDTRIQLQELQQQMEDLNAGEQKETADYQASIRELLTNLKAQVASWSDSYIFKSPMDGIVAFTKFRDVNQVVKTGDEVFTVIPENQGKTIGRITINGSGIGKIKLGQRVNIKFDNFPYMEFGMVLGKVSNISMVPSGKDYVVEVALPSELTTNYNRNLPFGQHMPGTAEIVTDDLPLIVRIFNPLKSLYKKYKNVPDTEPRNYIKAYKAPKDTLLQDTTKQKSDIVSVIRSEPDKSLVKYQIIGASFTSKDKAEKCKKGFENKGYSVQIIGMDDKFRVVMGSYPNRDRALVVLDSIKKAENDPSIWLLRLQ